jgi:hypothetical protein
VILVGPPFVPSSSQKRSLSIDSIFALPQELAQ